MLGFILYIELIPQTDLLYSLFKTKDFKHNQLQGVKNYANLLKLCITPLFQSLPIY
jgi:hypothetical protein